MYYYIQDYLNTRCDSYTVSTITYKGCIYKLAQQELKVRGGGDGCYWRKSVTTLTLSVIVIGG